MAGGIHKIRRKIIRLSWCFFMHSLAALVLVLTFFVYPVTRAASFSDVSENTVHYGAVEYLKAKNIISGYPDGTFQSDKTINRAEALKMVMLASVANLESQTVLDFPDVPSSEWFYQYVQRAFELKIVKGYDDGRFKPENNINVAESLKIILLSFQIAASDPPAADPYPDVGRLAWYAPYAEYSRVKQLIGTLDDGKLHAERDITRGEFAEIIYRLMYVRELNLSNFPLSTNWPNSIHPTDHYSVKYPFGWEKMNAGAQVILWKQDKENQQLSFARIFPNAATVVVAVDRNQSRLSLSNYVDLLDYEQGVKVQKLTLNNYPFASITVASTGVTDYYFELPNKTILAVYSQVGSGLNKPQLLQEIRYLVGSIRYHEGTTTEGSDRDIFLSEVRKNILVKDMGQATLDLFKDEILIETDTIGIGTGPIDYYYSAAYDVTLKYERDSNTLLALSDTKNTAF